MNISALIFFVLVCLVIFAVLAHISRISSEPSKQILQAEQDITGQILNGLYDIGSYHPISASQSIVTGGMLAYAASQASMAVTPGSALHFSALAVLMAALFVILSRPIVTKSVTAISSPSPTLLVKYAFISKVVYEKAIAVDKPVWIRVRLNGYKDLFIEVGNRSYETVEIFRLPNKNGEGLDAALQKASTLATLWQLENKGLIEGDDWRR